MSEKGVERKHSATALFAALYRAIAHKELKNEKLGPDYLAEHFLPAYMKFFIKFGKIRASVRKKNRKLTPGMFEYMLARTAYFDNAFVDALNKKFPQIVLLGAGYDTRACRFSKLNSATRIYELDISTTQNRKKKHLKNAIADLPQQVIFVPIDFNTESLVDVLEKVGYERTQKTLFVWEGVTYYLEQAAVDETLTFVKTFSHHESIIAFDYAISVSEEKMGNYFGAREFTETWTKHRRGEPFKFTFDDGQAGPFFEKRGLKIVNHLDNREIEKAFLRDGHGSVIGQINGLFRFALASPN